MGSMNDLVVIVELYRPCLNALEHGMLPPHSECAWCITGLGWHGIAEKWLRRILNDTWLAEALDYKRVRVSFGGSLEGLLVPRNHV